MYHFPYPTPGAIVSSAGEMRPGRLWSLLDMIEVYANGLYLIGESLSTIYAKLNMDPFDRAMVQISEHRLSTKKGTIAWFVSGISKQERAQLQNTVDKHNAVINLNDETHRQQLIHATKKMNVQFDLMGLSVSKVMLQRIIGRLDSGVMPTAAEVRELSARIRDELESRKFLYLNDSQFRLYEPKEPLFGQLVEDKFPSKAVFEIDEAAKCLALGRSTACVFHLMRLLEVGIGAVRQCVGISDPLKDAERNWGTLIRKLNEAIEARKGVISPSDHLLFADVLAFLHAVKTAWRNPGLHVEKVYTAEEAEHIWNATRGLMMKLASRLDEDGNPKA